MFHESFKRKNKTKKIHTLMKDKRKNKEKILQTKNIDEKDKLKGLNIIIDETIIKEEKKVRAQEMTKQINKIKQGGGINSAAFWLFKKQIDNNKGKELAHAMMDKNEVKKTNIEDIKEIFQEFYETLFTKDNKDESMEKKMANEIKEVVFQGIAIIAKREIQNIKNDKIRKDEIVKQINKLKNKHTIDPQGWNNVILKNGGCDIVESLQVIFSEINETKLIPKEWIEMYIISIYKNKGKVTDMENRRGIFIVSAIYKLYEKIKMERNENKINGNISKYQCGGIKGKSTIDNIMTLNAVIDYNKFLKSETYILFADAYKCFDKLDLKDCINDLYKCIGAREAMEAYALNNRGSAIIKTQVGEVGPVKVNEVVRQGTILGPKLCGINTDKVNKIGNKCITSIGSRINIETQIFVDDIENASSNVKQLKRAVLNLRSMETIKGYTFNNKKDKTAVLIINKKINERYGLNLNVKLGKIECTNEYKYLGEWYNEKGDHSTSLRKKG